MIRPAVDLHSETIATVDGAPRAPERRRRPTAAVSCLVVTADAALRSTVTAAALERGVRCVAPADTAQLADVCDADYRMAFVDVAAPLSGRDESARQLAASLATRPGMLLTVCGHQEREDEERWARELGAFVYLPGVARAGVTALVREICR